MMRVQFIEKDQNWATEETVYWFQVSGVDYHTEAELDGVFGVVESGCDEPVVVDSDNCQVTSDRTKLTVLRHCEITDEIRNS